MIKTRLKYCVFDPDPNGNERYYVRKPGQKKIRIRQTFEDADGRITPPFMKAYFEALETLDEKPAAPPKTPREKTFYWLVDQYYRSSKFKNFDQLTQADKRGVLDRFCQTAGDLPYAALRKEDVESSQDKRRATPGAADKLVKYLRSLFVWAIEKKLATFNPAVGVAKINETEGWHAWTPAEVDIYRGHYKIGTKARLALELMLNVGARISDASRIGRQHETNGWLVFCCLEKSEPKVSKDDRVPNHARAGWGAGRDADRRHSLSRQRSWPAVYYQWSRQQDAGLVRRRRSRSMHRARAAKGGCGDPC